MNVRCELLCYSFNYANKSSVGGLTDCLVQFYKPDEIYKAREMLWNELQQQLNDANVKKPRRTQPPTNAESARPFAEDISQGVHAMDPDAIPVTFYAVDLRRIPPCPPEEINVFSLAARLNALEQKLTSANDSRSKPNWSKTCSSAQEIPEGHILGATPSETMYSEVAIAAAASDQKWTTVEKKNRRNRRAAAVRKYVKNDDSIRSVVGTGADTEVKACTPTVKLFVHEVQKPCSADVLKQYFETKKIGQVNVRQISKESWAKASFCVTVDKKNSDDVFSDDFWPKGVKVREWVPVPRMQKNAPPKEGESENAEDNGSD